MRQVIIAGIVGISLLLGVVACTNKPDVPEMELEKQMERSIETNAEGNVLVVPLKDRQDLTRATAFVKKVGDGVEIEVEADHLQPGEYGFHIHEQGRCEAPDFASAGGHFNPGEKEHGLDHEEGAHAGDMDNLVIKADGSVRQIYELPHLSLKKGEEYSLFQPGGTSLMMHEGADDGYSQPAGNAGERILCGVIAAERE